MPEPARADGVGAVSIRHLLATAGRRLAIDGGPATLEAEVLLAHVMQADRVWLHTHPEAEPPLDARRRFDALVDERVLARTPIAYLTGTREFYGIPLVMRRGVFIPRPETEGLVDRVATWLRGRPGGGAGAVVAEPCCGSGAIAVALARTTGCRMIATDLSPAAVALARQNADAAAVGPLVQVVPGCLLEPVQAGLRLDAVVCNPPYVRRDEMPGLAPDITRHEPELALVAGEDGLGVIRTLVGQAASRLAAGGLLAMEIGAGQGAAAAACLAEGPWDAVRCEQDLAGRDRYILANRRPGTAP